jgi:hypothetical protein
MQSFVWLVYFLNILNSQNILTSAVASNVAGNLSQYSSGLSNLISQNPEILNNPAAKTALTNQIQELIKQKQGGGSNNIIQNTLKNINPGNQTPTINSAVQNKLLSNLSYQTLSQLNLKDPQNLISPAPQNNPQQNLYQNNLQQYPQQNPYQNTNVQSDNMQLFYLLQLPAPQQMAYLQQLALVNPYLSYTYMQYLAQVDRINAKADPIEDSSLFFSPLNRNEIDKKLKKTDPIPEKDVDEKKSENNSINNDWLEKGSWEYRRRFNNPNEKYHSIKQEEVKCESCHNFPVEVCGDDGKTYINACHAKCNSVFYVDGKCPESTPRGVSYEAKK